MLRNLSLRTGCATILVAVLCVPCAGGQTMDFGRTVAPLLSNRCFKCHGPAKQEGGLRLDLAVAATKKLPSGQTAVVPGAPHASEIIARITSQDPDTRMPPVDEGEPLTTSQIDLLRDWIAQGAVYTRHWAYQPPTRPAAPAVMHHDWSRNPIDAFVLARLEATRLQPATEAPRELLLRRVTLDLTGLPPTPDEVQAFVNDSAPDAYPRVVERLLASPQFGVRQAQAWLDLARYADTDGYPSDGARSVWPYRDWVVDALNADMSYDQFTIEQIAGDLLSEPTEAQRIATGFHRQTRINREAGVDPEEFRLEAVFDRVNTTATIWLGATLACAQCHDHKYDPFTQRDFYRLLAYFNNDASETTSDAAGKITDVSPRLKCQSLSAGSDKVETLVMQAAERPRETRILVRGSFLTPGEVVTAGPPAVFESLADYPGVDRLALARWLVDQRNPLTARVAVNRLWAQYFGAGLVESLDDLGAQAPPCSHPELLDWLAAEFMHNDWRWKPLHRLIVTSATYRQAPLVDEAKRRHDPHNRLLSRGPRLRLSAEVIRDNALAATGLLSTQLGGPSVPAQSKPPADSRGVRHYRRSIYLQWRRQNLDDMFVTFDAPSRDITCTRRTRTNTPLQALNLLNDQPYLDCARNLARLAQDAGGSWNEQLDLIFTRALARRPNSDERTTLLALFERRRAAYQSDTALAIKLIGSADTGPGAAERANADAGSDCAERAAWILVANTLLNLNEFITRE